MKIVSLLPSATEIVFALGLGDSLVGVTFECDHPAEARAKRIVSGTALTEHESPGDIDAQVSAMVADGQSIYTLDDLAIRELAPDVILAQDLCRVCAVPSGAVNEALDVLGCRADVVSLDPMTLDDVIACLGQVGAATGTSETADHLMAELRRRVATVRTATAGRERPRVLVLEWGDPPFNGGHWMPDMVEAAGGDPALSRSGQRSIRLDWDTVAGTHADAIVFCPCGFDLAGGIEQAAPLLARAELAHIDRFYAVDGNAHFSRPGPRVVDGVEVLAGLLHPEVWPMPSSDHAQRLR